VINTECLHIQNLRAYHIKKNEKEQRKKLWINSVICATPEITRNDIAREIVDTTQFNLIIFDEAHRAVGVFAYV